MISTKLIYDSVAEFLIQIGIKPFKKGFIYFIDSVVFAYQSERPFQVVRDIYKPVADLYGVTTQRVERNIRYALKKIDLDALNQVLSSNLVAVPTPKKLFLMICDYLK